MADMITPIYERPLFTAALLAIVFLITRFFLPIWTRAIKLSRIPLADKRPGEWFDGKARKRLAQNYVQILADGIKKYPEGFQIVGEGARQIVIPPQYTHLVNTDARFTTTEPLEAFIKFSFRGFEGSRSILAASPSQKLFLTMMRSKLNQNLTKMTTDLAAEANSALAENWGLESEWHEISLMPTILSVVSRMTTRIFLGPELCRNSEWLKTVVEYAVNTFQCARTLRRYPVVIARVAQWFLKDCKALREQVVSTRRLLGPTLEQHLKTFELAKQGLADMPNNAVVWTHEVAKGEPYDPVIIQLGVCVTAIHTTTDLLSQTLLDLVAHPEIIEPLRREIEEVFREHGWGKSAVQNLKLLDSVIKETQRLKPASGATTGRYATEEVILPNGLVIPKGSFVFSSMQRMWDDEYYPNHEKWDGYRFYNMRKDPSQEARCQLVTTSPEHLGFGHGVHACPGRFLAATEVKIMLSCILMNYDFDCGGGEVPKPWINGLEFLSNPMAKLRVRRRRTD